MTRTDFQENVTSWWELIDFCRDNDCYYCDDIYDDDMKDDYINSNLSDMVVNATSWRDLLDTLEAIPTGYNFYRKDEYDEFYEADEDDFDSYKQDVLDWCDDNDVWEPGDDDEDDEEPERDEEIPEDEPSEETSSLGDFFMLCLSESSKIFQDETNAGRHQKLDIRAMCEFDF